MSQHLFCLGTPHHGSNFTESPDTLPRPVSLQLQHSLPRITIGPTASDYPAPWPRKGLEVSYIQVCLFSLVQLAVPIDLSYHSWVMYHSILFKLLNFLLWWSDYKMRWPWGFFFSQLEKCVCPLQLLKALPMSAWTQRTWRGVFKLQNKMSDAGKSTCKHSPVFMRPKKQFLHPSKQQIHFFLCYVYVAEHQHQNEPTN